MASAARERNAAAERLVRSLIERGELLYGVTTGVGSLRSRAVGDGRTGDHQWRLLRSHAGGGGAPLTVEVVRAAMAVRANQLGAGGAGVGDRLLDALLGALRAGVTPFARELGSLGTGDLTVLAEIGTALGGEGECWVGDEVVPAAEALAAHGLEPVRYGPRDGIAFMSSNAVSIGQAALVFHDATRLLDSALGVAALSYEAAAPTSRCSTRACTPRARTTARSRSRGGCASCSATGEPRERAAGARDPRRVRVPLRAAGRGHAARRARAARGRARDRAQRRGRERADAPGATASRCRTATSTPAS